MDEHLREKMNAEINNIIKSRSEFIGNNYPRIRSAYQNSYHDPELDPLRHEICLCLLFGLHQAAITLTNHLMESMLKHGLIIQDAKEKEKNRPVASEGPPTVSGLIDLFSESRKKYSSASLGDNINSAARVGLISKEEKKELHRLRESLRNAYSHADKNKTFGDASAGVTAIRIKEGEIKSGDQEMARLADLLVGQGLFQAMQAQEEAVEYFLFIDKLTRQVLTKIFGEKHFQSREGHH